MKLILDPLNEPSLFAVTDRPKYRIRRSGKIDGRTRVYHCEHVGVGRGSDLKIESKSMLEFIGTMEKKLRKRIQIWTEESGYPVRIDKEVNEIPHDQRKRCAGCGFSKTLDEFYKKERGLYGRRGTCKLSM